MSEQIERSMKNTDGHGPIEKHILLLKLTEALEKTPDFGDEPILDAASPQRQWLSQVGALLKRLSIEHSMQVKTSRGMLLQYWKWSIDQIKGQVLDAIEELKLDLELDGRSDIGSAYSPGDIYRFFADLKEIINSANNEIMIVDPYFNGEAFNAYLSTVNPSVDIKILADRYSNDINVFVEIHVAQLGRNIELKQSNELHDRIIFIDDNVAWIMGGSIKDAGKKATYLFPLETELALAKKEIYTELWNRAKPV